MFRAPARDKERSLTTRKVRCESVRLYDLYDLYGENYQYLYGLYDIKLQYFTYLYDSKRLHCLGFSPLSLTASNTYL